MGMFFLPKDVILSAGFQAIWIFNIGQIKSVPRVSMGKNIKMQPSPSCLLPLTKIWVIGKGLLSIHLEKKRVKLGSPKSPVQWLSLLHKEMLFKRLNNWSTMLHFLIQAEINSKKYIQIQDTDFYFIYFWISLQQTTLICSTRNSSIHFEKHPLPYPDDGRYFFQRKKPASTFDCLRPTVWLILLI